VRSVLDATEHGAKIGIASGESPASPEPEPATAHALASPFTNLTARSVLHSAAVLARGARGRTGENAILRIYEDMLGALKAMRGMIGAIEKRDPDLGRQLRRASSSVVLNVAEGSGSFGRVRTMRYRTALGSARETLACLRVAEAFGYVETLPETLVDTMDRVVGTLVRVSA
jgi:four helix bundle protein